MLAEQKMDQINLIEFSWVCKSWLFSASIYSTGHVAEVTFRLRFSSHRVGVLTSVGNSLIHTVKIIIIKT